MPAVSKAQFRFFEMLKHNPKMRKEKGVSERVADEYTQESPKGLPDKKKLAKHIANKIGAKK